MKTNVIVQNPAFTLDYSDYNTQGSRQVTWEELKNDPIGTEYDGMPCGGTCGRDIRDEQAKIIYRDENGVAVLFTTIRSTDDPNPKGYELEPILTWFQYTKKDR
jgi:hypothetical protein